MSIWHNSLSLSLCRICQHFRLKSKKFFHPFAIYPPGCLYEIHIPHISGHLYRLISILFLFFVVVHFSYLSERITFTGWACVRACVVPCRALHHFGRHSVSQCSTSIFSINIHFQVYRANCNLAERTKCVKLNSANKKKINKKNKSECAYM